MIGGNSGIGLATARLLKGQGISLVAAARSPGPLAELGITVLPFDARHPAALELPPVLDGLVYFPGSITLKPFHRLTEEDFLNDFRINCLGAVAVLQAASETVRPSTAPLAAAMEAWNDSPCATAMVEKSTTEAVGAAISAGSAA